MFKGQWRPEPFKGSYWSLRAEHDGIVFRLVAQSLERTKQGRCVPLVEVLLHGTWPDGTWAFAKLLRHPKYKNKNPRKLKPLGADERTRKQEEFGQTVLKLAGLDSDTWINQWWITEDMFYREMQASPFCEGNDEPT